MISIATFPLAGGRRWRGAGASRPRGVFIAVADAMRALFAVAAASVEGAAGRAEEARPGRPLTAMEAAHFRASMLPHLDAAYTLARYLTRDADAAQDIVQDAYLRAYRAFADFKGGSARAWLLAIVRNCHLTWRDHRRREMQRRAPDAVAAEDGGDTDDALDLLVDGETPETILLRRSQADRVRGTLELLPEPLREVLVLRELDELSYREIADVAGVPVGTVMSRLSRARRHFADLWERVAAGPEAVR
ncbi:sigma-70 family RNA polymerase sigma factor [Xanthobacter aminoxidans]|uniref:sigma-70 family RNA polymerase sigma factor n=2 Tax=Xanthobacter TaxID=279 RepID=UPI00372924A9